MSQEKCSDINCNAHVGESCIDGESKLEKCKKWRSRDKIAGVTKTEATQTGVRVNWSGSALGTTDLWALLPRARHLLIGVLGSHDSGKTTLLLANYLLMLRGHSLGKLQFCGSRTFGAWEALASWLRFHDAIDSPTFPPHTPRGTDRVPGLLHFALRNEQDEFRDVLLTDAPGEWFAAWSTNEHSPAANGAQWIADNANAFLVMADSEQLSGQNRGIARKTLRELIERLGNHVNQRPVILVWTKCDSDHCVPEGIRETIKDALYKNIPHAIEMTVTVSQPETMSTTLSDIIEQCWSATNANAIREPIINHLPFYAFRGPHDRA
jgi:hypothetical protein